VLLFGLRGVAADRANVEVARRADPGIQLAANQQRNGFAVEAGVGLLGLQGSGEGADGGGVLARRGLGKKAGIHGVDLVLLAAERGLQVFERALHLDRMNLALRLAAQLLDDAGVIGGVNLLGARGGAEEAGGSVQPSASALTAKAVYLACAFDSPSKAAKRF
jgi:hypothetical protein